MKANLALAGLVLVAAAAVLASDVQVPLDLTGKTTQIDRALEKKLGLFPDTPGFLEARMFRLEDGTFMLEISRESRMEVLRDRIPMSATTAGEFRARVSDTISRLSPQTALDQKGRSRLINGIRILSIVYYGPALPGSFNIQNGTVAGGMYFLTAGTGFFVPLWLTKSRPVPEGPAELALYGGYNGIAHAFLLNASVMGMENIHGRTAVAESLILSLGEMYCLFGLADRYGISGGQGRAMMVASEFGLVGGLGAAFLAGTGERTSRAYGIAGLAGSAGGLWAGHYLAGRRNYSLGDASLLQVTGGLGAFIPIALLKSFGVNGSKELVAAGLTGAVSGFSLGDWLASDRDLTEGQTFLLGLGTASGGLLGLGIAYVARPNDPNQRLFFAASGVGAAAGLAVTWRLIRDDMQLTVPVGGMVIRTFPANLMSARPLPLLTAEVRF